MKLSMLILVKKEKVAKCRNNFNEEKFLQKKKYSLLQQRAYTRLKSTYYSEIQHSHK